MKPTLARIGCAVASVLFALTLTPTLTLTAAAQTTSQRVSLAPRPMSPAADETRQQVDLDLIVAYHVPSSGVHIAWMDQVRTESPGQVWLLAWTVTHAGVVTRHVGYLECGYENVPSSNVSRLRIARLTELLPDGATRAITVR
jgi:hypothetical protein